MEIQSRFTKGDVVFSAETEYKENWVCCPDCAGTLRWTVVFADGEAIEVECQTCKRGYEASSGKIDIKSWLPKVRRLTIGAIRFDDTATEKFSYMCEETGVGSGRVYYDNDLFLKREDAEEASNKKHQEQMKHIAQNNFSKRFGGTKELEAALSSWGFSRKSVIEKAALFRQWAKLSKIITPKQ